MIPSLASAILHTEIPVSVAAHRLKVHISSVSLYFTASLPVPNSVPFNPNLQLQLRCVEMEKEGTLKDDMQCMLMGTRETVQLSAQRKGGWSWGSDVWDGRQEDQFNFFHIPYLAGKGSNAISGCHTDVRYHGSSF